MCADRYPPSQGQANQYSFPCRNRQPGKGKRRLHNATRSRPITYASLLVSIRPTRQSELPWFPSSSLGTSQFGAINGQTSVPKLELGNQGARTDGFGECLPLLVLFGSKLGGQYPSGPQTALAKTVNSRSVRHGATRHAPPMEWVNCIAPPATRLQESPSVLLLRL